MTRSEEIISCKCDNVILCDDIHGAVRILRHQQKYTHVIYGDATHGNSMQCDGAGRKWDGRWVCHLPATCSPSVTPVSSLQLLLSPVWWQLSDYLVTSFKFITKAWIVIWQGVFFCEMLKHCPSLRMEREVELHGKVSIEGLVEKETHTTSENDTVCPSCGGQHRRLRVYKASPASHHQQEQNSTMDFTTVPLSPTTTSAMVVEESLRRFCQLWPMNIFHIEILPGFTWAVQTLDYSPWWSSWGTRTPGRRGSPARRSLFWKKAPTAFPDDVRFLIISFPGSVAPFFPPFPSLPPLVLHLPPCGKQGGSGEPLSLSGSQPNLSSRYIQSGERGKWGWARKAQWMRCLLCIGGLII